MARHQPILYEINTNAWLAELSRSYGQLIRLGNVPDAEFESWDELGFTHIWLMGVWRTGPQSLNQALLNWNRFWTKEESTRNVTADDIISSPYAIMDYHVPDHLGGERGLHLFRSRLAERDIKLILDFVPNHLGVDHPWILTRPDLLVSSESEHKGTFHPPASESRRWFAHGKDPWFPSWTDTVQLDYRNPDTHAAMLHILKSIAGRCDGVRCDMAMLLLPEIFAGTWEAFPLPAVATKNNFWEIAIPQIEQEFDGFTFIGEVYWDLEERMQKLGFDYTYDKRVYDHIVARNPSALRKHLSNQSAACLKRSVHFLENHDEPRVSSLLSRAEHRAAAVLILGLPGLPLLHDGQLSGRRLFNRIQIRARPDEEPDQFITEMYESLLTALQGSAIGNGEGRILPIASIACENCFVVQWHQSPRAVDLVAVNLGAASAQLVFNLQGRFSSVERWEARHRFGDHAPVLFDPQDLGVRLQLQPHGCEIVTLRAPE